MELACRGEGGGEESFEIQMTFSLSDDVSLYEPPLLEAPSSPDREYEYGVLANRVWLHAMFFF